MRNNSRRHVPRANGFVSVILGLLMLILVCVFLLLLAVRSISTARVIQDTDIAWVLEETGVSNEIVDQINRLPFVEDRVDIRDVDAFIRNDVVSREISRALGGYLAAFAEGDLSHHITQGEVLYIVRNLEPELNNMFGHQMTEADHERLSRALDDAVDFRRLSIGNLMDEADVDLTIPQFAASGNLLILVGILCIVTLLLMVLHHRRTLSDVLKNAGVPIMLAGLVCFLLGFVISSYTQMFGALFHRISSLLSAPIGLFITYSLYAAGIGAALVIVHMVMRATRPRL